MSSAKHQSFPKAEICSHQPTSEIPWSDRLRCNGWTEVGVYGAKGEKPSVRLWEHPHPHKIDGADTGSRVYAIQVFAGRCEREVVFKTVRDRAQYRSTQATGFWEIASLSAKARSEDGFNPRLEVGKLENCSAEDRDQDDEKPPHPLDRRAQAG